MPSKNPGRPTEPSARQQAIQTLGNIDMLGPPPLDSSIGTAGRSTNPTTRLSNHDLKFYLKDRNASPNDVVHDWWTSGLVEKINGYNQCRFTFEKLDHLTSLAQRFVDKSRTLRETTAAGTSSSPTEEIRNIVDTFHKNLCERLWESGSCSINEHDFNMDLNEARDKNLNRQEAFFQHTIMMYSTDHWRLNSTFAYNCGEGWLKDAPGLPLSHNSRDGTNLVLGLKPDLIVSFQMCAIRGPFGKELNTFADTFMSHFAVYPDGNDTTCFPFLVIDVKKNDGDMRRALYTSIYGATRALYNIYLCMRRTKKMREFFRDVRTFSISMSPNEFEARIHRVAWDEQFDEPKFLFDVLDSRAKYTRNEIVAVMRTTTVDYAQTLLLPLLQEVYEALARTRGEPMEVEGEIFEAWREFLPDVKELTVDWLKERMEKRKADDELAPPCKRAKQGSDR